MRLPVGFLFDPLSRSTILSLLRPMSMRGRSPTSPKAVTDVLRPVPGNMWQGHLADQQFPWLHPIQRISVRLEEAMIDLQMTCRRCNFDWGMWTVVASMADISGVCLSRLHRLWSMSMLQAGQSSDSSNTPKSIHHSGTPIHSHWAGQLTAAGAKYRPSS